MPDEPEKSSKPIGVFDSGIGGLTVVRALRRQLPSEKIIYFGDTARVPYGTKSAETIRRYTREISSFLNNQGIKLVVVACNSCSATALDCVEEEFGGPVIGVIEPGAQRAVGITRNGKIGVIGTKATIHSGAYEKALHELEESVEVFSTACPLFVPLAEEGMETHPAAQLIAREYLEPLMEQSVDTLILGCTHYPLLKRTIEEVVGEGVAVVDSAESTAEAALEVLTARGEMNSNPNSETTLIRTYVSDDPMGVEKFCGTLMPSEKIWVGTAQPAVAFSNK